jgi:homoserine O-acetyltransferase
MRNLWEAWFIPMDPNNLLTMAWKWRHGDVSKHTGGDLAVALGRIKAKTFVTSFAGDMFFPVSDLEDEQALIPDDRQCAAVGHDGQPCPSACST